VVLLAVGTAAVDVARYVMYVAWGLVLPGTLVYRALRGTPRSLVDDVAVGTVVGFTLELPAWAGCVGTGHGDLLWLWPFAVVVPFVAVPRLRRHWRPGGYTRPSLAWSWSVAAIVLAVLGYVAFAYLYGPPPVPTSGDHGYFMDLPYLLSLVGEAKHHFPLVQPQVSAEPLYYHWFAYAHEAASSLISGVDTPVVFYRFAVPLFCVVSVVALAVVGWRVSGQPWVGVVAAALMFLVAEFSVGTVAPTFGNVFLRGVWSSHSQAFSYMFVPVVVALVADRLSGTEGSRLPWGRGGWVLLTILCFACAGVRSTIPPVLIGGLAVAGVVQLVRRRLRRRWLAVLVPVLGAQLFATVVLFGGTSNGLDPRPFDAFAPLMASPGPRPLWKAVVLFAVVCLAYLVYMTIRLAAVPAIPRWGAPEWFLLGTFAAGLGATLMLSHPAWGQVNFIRTSFVCGALLSATGYVTFVQRRGTAPRLVAAFVGVAVLVAGTVFGTLVLLRGSEHGDRFHALEPVYLDLAGFAAVLAVGALLWPLVRRQWTVLRGSGPVLVLTVVIGAGLPGTVWEACNVKECGAAAYPADSTVVTADRFAAARWLRANSGTGDIVATNHRCDDTCRGNLDFWLEAYAERRLLVGNWGYAPRSIAEDARGNKALATSPFWNLAELATNDATFYAPDRSTVDTMRRRYHVRWLVVDRGLGTESPRLQEFAALRWNRGLIAVYQLPA
jgi:hypothetical protein